MQRHTYGERVRDRETKKVSGERRKEINVRGGENVAWPTGGKWENERRRKKYKGRINVRR